MPELTTLPFPSRPNLRVLVLETCTLDMTFANDTRTPPRIVQLVTRHDNQKVERATKVDGVMYINLPYPRIGDDVMRGERVPLSRVDDSNESSTAYYFTISHATEPYSLSFVYDQDIDVESVEFSKVTFPFANTIATS